MNYTKLTLFILLAASSLPQASNADDFLPKQSAEYLNTIKNPNKKSIIKHSPYHTQNLYNQIALYYQAPQLAEPFDLSRKELITILNTKEEAENILKNLSETEKNTTIKIYGHANTEKQFGDKLQDVERK